MGAVRGATAKVAAKAGNAGTPATGVFALTAGRWGFAGAAAAGSVVVVSGVRAGVGVPADTAWE
jgi:hypothetical protein